MTFNEVPEQSGFADHPARPKPGAKIGDRVIKQSKAVAIDVLFKISNDKSHRSWFFSPLNTDVVWLIEVEP